MAVVAWGSTPGLCPLLAWNCTSLILAVVCLGLESVTLWRRGAGDVIRVVVDALPTSVWWSLVDSEVRAVCVCTQLAQRVMRLATPCGLWQVLFIGTVVGTILAYDCASSEAWSVPCGFLSKAKAAITSGACKSDGTMAVISADKVVRCCCRLRFAVHVAVHYVPLGISLHRCV